MPVKENKAYIAVVDTNVIISALLSHYSDAATSLVLDYLFKGLIVPLYNKEKKPLGKTPKGFFKFVGCGFLPPFLEIPETVGKIDVD